MATYGDLLTQIENKLNIKPEHCSIDGRLKDIAKEMASKGNRHSADQLDAMRYAITLKSEMLESILASLDEDSGSDPIPESDLIDADPVPEADLIDISGMLKAELQAVCDQIGVPRSGTKAELIDRILDARGDMYVNNK
ncbi:SAP domain-containing protein [Treponema sp.]|uniref:SAP domain-containing protein n=1 Tax=Treponema sp. TaxID=166 RepID=UPI003890B417